MMRSEISVHNKLLNKWPSAYALSKETGVPFTTAKRWKNKGFIADPSWWMTLIESGEPSNPYWVIDLVKECDRRKK